MLLSSHSPLAALSFRPGVFSPVFICYIPGTRRLGAHRLGNSTCVSFPIGHARVCRSCHHGPVRLTGVHTAVSAIHGSTSAHVASVHVGNCTSPRNDCTGGAHLTRKHARALGSCMRHLCGFPSNIVTASCRPRS